MLLVNYMPVRVLTTACILMFRVLELNKQQGTGRRRGGSMVGIPPPQRPGIDEHSMDPEQEAGKKIKEAHRTFGGLLIY
jgi:hypothetical protein